MDFDFLLGGDWSESEPALCLARLLGGDWSESGEGFLERPEDELAFFFAGGESKKLENHK